MSNPAATDRCPKSTLPRAYCDLLIAEFLAETAAAEAVFQVPDAHGDQFESRRGSHSQVRPVAVLRKTASACLA